MSRQIQIRRGTADENDAFTGAIGEITMDTTNKTLRVHDGSTLGGTVLAKQNEIPDLTNVDYVVESQLPSAQNGYSWYRKYKSGWIEQGGRVTTSSTWNGGVLLPKAFTNKYYNIQATVSRNSFTFGVSGDAYNYFVTVEPVDTVSFCWITIGHAGTQGFRPFQWVAYGY